MCDNDISIVRFLQIGKSGPGHSIEMMAPLDELHIVEMVKY